MFTRQMVQRGIVQRERLLALLLKTPVTEAVRDQIRSAIDVDFALAGRRR